MLLEQGADCSGGGRAGAAPGGQSEQGGCRGRRQRHGAQRAGGSDSPRSHLVVAPAGHHTRAVALLQGAPFTMLQQHRSWVLTWL